jgi:soluble lytic murein transglycosylase-like protein
VRLTLRSAGLVAVAASLFLTAAAFTISPAAEAQPVRDSGWQSTVVGAVWDSESPTASVAPSATPTESPLATASPTPKPTAKPTARPKPKPKPIVYPDTVTGARAYVKSRIGATQYNCINPLWARESKWNPLAGKPAGAYGIPQAFPGSKMAKFGSNWLTSPLTQVKWGIWYVNGRYGSACGAWQFWQAHGWY